MRVQVTGVVYFIVRVWHEQEVFGTAQFKPGMGYGLAVMGGTTGLLRQYGVFAVLKRPYVFVSGAHWLRPFCILLNVHGLGFG
jgi:hypothetical protein